MGKGHSGGGPQGQLIPRFAASTAGRAGPLAEAACANRAAPHSRRPLLSRVKFCPRLHPVGTRKAQRCLRIKTNRKVNDPRGGRVQGDTPMATLGLDATDLAPSEHQRQLRRAVIASTVGTAIEWYDFFL